MVNIIGNRTNGFHKSLAKDKFLAVSSSRVALTHLDVDFVDEVGRAPAECVIVEPADLNSRGILTYSGEITLESEAEVKSVALLDDDGMVLFEANFDIPQFINAGFSVDVTMEVSV